MPYRASGILLHPTSLPGRFGIGDLGPAAYQFVDFLADSGQKLWQVLPLGPTGYGNSPYMSYSAMAGNPLLISPEKLRDQGLLTDAELENLPAFPDATIDYDRVSSVKMEWLWQAFTRFQSQRQEEFLAFCDRKADWLDDYAMFMAIKQMNRGKGWNAWNPAIAKRDPDALKACKIFLETEIAFRKYLQFEFFRQWGELRRYANQRGIQIIGDIPIYVAHDSADVWANPQNFCLHPKTGETTLMAGVPPDYFSVTGQLWGNPIYNWYFLRRENYRWWVQRFQGLLDLVDWIRIDHFRGFEAYWAVPYGETTAMNGWWIKGPRSAFFKAIADQLGQLPIIAEDLGVITPQVEALRDEFGFPGMKILQFAFGSGAGNAYLPHNYPRNCVAYTGTHDNDTTVGWFNQLSQAEQEQVRRYLGSDGSEEIHWDLIQLAMSSVADWAILPLQDILGLGTEARMNVPSKGEGNWAWRYKMGVLTEEIRDRLRILSETYGRVY